MLKKMDKQRVDKKALRTFLHRKGSSPGEWMIEVTEEGDGLLIEFTEGEGVPYEITAMNNEGYKEVAELYEELR